MILPDPPILVITDRRQCGEPLERRAEALFHGGCRFLSLREKDLGEEERRALLGRLVLLGGAFGATVGVHDDVTAASLCGAALHLPAIGDSAVARRILGPHALIGQSCHSRTEIAAAEAAGADYVTIGPVFPSGSKPGYAPRADITQDIVGFDIPILALGGIMLATPPRLPSGFSGIAMMGEAMTAPDPADWFSRVRTAWSASHRV